MAKSYTASDLRSNRKLSITTIKTFLRQNKGKLFVKERSRFCGMTDGIEFNANAKFLPAIETDDKSTRNLGYWGLDRATYNHVYFYEDKLFWGLVLSNCIGESIVVTPKQ